MPINFSTGSIQNFVPAAPPQLNSPLDVYSPSFPWTVRNGKAESEPVAASRHGTSLDAAHMVTGHQLNCFWGEDSHAVELSASKHHHAKAHVVAGRGGEAAATAKEGGGFFGKVPAGGDRGSWLDFGRGVFGQKCVGIAGCAFGCVELRETISLVHRDPKARVHHA